MNVVTPNPSIERIRNIRRGHLLAAAHVKP
jgi:hypothetical protein